MEEIYLSQEPLLGPSPKQQLWITLALGAAGAILMTLVQLLIPSYHFSTSWIVGMLLGIVLIVLWRRASCLADVAFLAAGIVTGGGSSVLAIVGCIWLPKVLPEATSLARSCSVNYLRGGAFANAYGVFFGTWVFGWALLRWMTWGRERRVKKAREWQERFGGKRDDRA